MPAHTTSPTPSAASRTRPIVRPGCWAALIASPARPTGVRTSPFIPSATSSVSEGSGSGAQSSASGGSVGAAERSNSTVAMSTPDTPSTSAW